MFNRILNLENKIKHKCREEESLINNSRNKIEHSISNESNNIHHDQEII